MSTDNLVFPTKTELMEGTTLDYAPYCTVFNAVEHKAKIERIKFTTIKGDDPIVAKTINAQDTERAAVKVGPQEKDFVKIFKGGQFTESKYNANSALPGLNDKVIKAFSKQWDFETFNGVDNNGVIVSTDPNFINNQAKTLPAVIDSLNGVEALINLFTDFEKQIAATSSSKDVRYGVYGENVRKYFRKLLPNGKSYLQILKETFPNLDPEFVPDNLAPNKQGIFARSVGLVDLNHTLFPMVENTGFDEKAGEVWVNYIFGSAMIDVKEFGGLINQALLIG